MAQMLLDGIFQMLSRTFAVNLGKHFKELRIAAEPGRKNRLQYGGLYRVSVVLPKVREPQRISVPVEGHPDLLGKHSAEMGLAQPALPRNLPKRSSTRILAQELKSF